MVNIIWFSDCNYKNKYLVGGKNASLGELYTLSQKFNFKISNGFAITTDFYNDFLKNNNIKKNLDELILNLKSSDIENINLISKKIKKLINGSSFNQIQIDDITLNYNILCEIYNKNNIEVAVRSSAVAEDMPNASFAGQQDTYLNIQGIKNLLFYVKECFASLFNSRAISYRKTHNIKIDQILISVGIQKMIRSDIGSAGVAFSIDPESGYNKAIVINSSFGLGELVVSGGVKPD